MQQAKRNAIQLVQHIVAHFQICIVLKCPKGPEKKYNLLPYPLLHLWLFLLSQDEGEDELKKKQLKDLALMNGTLREQAGQSLHYMCCILLIPL